MGHEPPPYQLTTISGAEKPGAAAIADELEAQCADPGCQREGYRGGPATPACRKPCAGSPAAQPCPPRRHSRRMCAKVISLMIGRRRNRTELLENGLAPLPPTGAIGVIGVIYKDALTSPSISPAFCLYILATPASCAVGARPSLQPGAGAGGLIQRALAASACLVMRGAVHRQP